MSDTERHFRLEITSLEDLVKFVAILRGDTPDAKRLAALTARLKDSNDKLEETVEQHQSSEGV